MGFFSKKDKVTSKNAMKKADATLQATKAVGYQNNNSSSKSSKREERPQDFEDTRYGDKYMADVYVDVKDDDNVTMMFQLPDKSELDAKQAYYNRGGDVLPHGIATLVGKESMNYFNDLGATSLSFQKTGWRKGAVEEPSSKAKKGGKVFNFRLTGKELAAAFTYINAKRVHDYTFGFNSATFASHSLQAAGINVGITGGSSKKFRKAMTNEIINEKEETWTQTAVKTVRSVHSKDKETAPDELKYMAKREADVRRKGAILDDGAKTRIGGGTWEHAGMTDSDHKANVEGVVLENLYTDLSNANYRTLNGMERKKVLERADHAVVKQDIDRRAAADERVRQSAIREKYCSAISNNANNFMLKQDAASANVLISHLNETCPNEAAMAQIYVENKHVAAACGEALQMITFDQSLELTQNVRNDAKALLTRFAPEMASESAYQAEVARKEKKRQDSINSLHGFLNDYRKSRAKGFYGGATDFMNELEKKFDENGQCIPWTCLNMSTLKKEFGVVLQEMAYTEAVPMNVREHAVKLLSIIAPELNSVESFVENTTPSEKASPEEQQAFKDKREREVKIAGYNAFAREFNSRAKIGLRCNEQALEIFKIVDDDFKAGKNLDVLRDILGKLLQRIAFDKTVNVENNNRTIARGMLNSLDVFAGMGEENA